MLQKIQKYLLGSHEFTNLCRNVVNTFVFSGTYHSYHFRYQKPRYVSLVVKEKFGCGSLTLSCRRSLSYRNQSDLRANQWADFYMIGSSVIKELTTNAHII